LVARKDHPQGLCQHGTAAIRGKPGDAGRSGLRPRAQACGCGEFRFVRRTVPATARKPQIIEARRSVPSFDLHDATLSFNAVNDLPSDHQSLTAGVATQVGDLNGDGLLDYFQKTT
jgi:hypothetical protein